MNIVTLDFETYFADDFTLSRMTTEAYIRDPRFEVHGAAVKWTPDQAPIWYNEPELRAILGTVDWSQNAMLCHHVQFDGFILNHHYDVRPAFWFDTLSMARMLLGNHVSASLDSLRRHFNIPPKLTPYNLFKNKHWSELTPDTQRLVAEGACDEVSSIGHIFSQFSQGFPVEEYRVIDTTLRMFTQPVLRADTQMLAKVWTDEANKKQKLLEQLNLDESDLQSADKFSELLRHEGVEPEVKPGKNGDIPAFAKTDDFMRGLLEHDNETVRTLAEARLGCKATFLQTRAETLGWMASRGPLPVYLSYAGAGTLRPSGGDKCNWLNFKRNSDIRRAIMAPEGYLLAPIDSSQIECRVLHYLAGGRDEPVLQMFRNGVDPYADLATKFYGETIYKPAYDDPRKLEMEQKRGAGKQGRLMCGYGAAGKQFQAAAKAGLYGPPISMEREDADRFVATYRVDTPSVCARNTGYWVQAERMLARLAGGPPLQWGPLEIRDHKIYLPNGARMNYDTIEFYRPVEDDEIAKLKDFEREGYWRVRTRSGWKKMWGSKLVQNICEAVSRVIVTQAMNRITGMGYRVLNHPYDELLTLIPKDGREDWHAERCVAEMKREVDWLPGLPLDAEFSLSERYSK